MHACFFLFLFCAIGRKTCVYFLVFSSLFFFIMWNEETCCVLHSFWCSRKKKIAFFCFLAQRGKTWLFLFLMSFLFSFVCRKEKTCFSSFFCVCVVRKHVSLHSFLCSVTSGKNIFVSVPFCLMSEQTCLSFLVFCVVRTKTCFLCNVKWGNMFFFILFCVVGRKTKHKMLLFSFLRNVKWWETCFSFLYSRKKNQLFLICFWCSRKKHVLVLLSFSRSRKKKQTCVFLFLFV